jgi:hypothetical protein
MYSGEAGWVSLLSLLYIAFHLHSEVSSCGKTKEEGFRPNTFLEQHNGAVNPVLPPSD